MSEQRTDPIIRQILEIAVDSGKILLENGAETYRVEETINRICASKDIHVESFVVPTGIFISCHVHDEYYSYVKRIRQVIIDMEIIMLINDFSRRFVNNEFSLDDAEKRLNEIRHAPKYTPATLNFFGAVGGSFFTLLFRGTYLEFIIAFFTSYIVLASLRRMSRYVRSGFVKNMCGGAIASFVAMLLVQAARYIPLYLDLDKIIIGCIMPLVPGVAMTNALRDSIAGDYVSGLSKLSEALLSAVAIAIGVGMGLQVRYYLTGGY